MTFPIMPPERGRDMTGAGLQGWYDAYYRQQMDQYRREKALYQYETTGIWPGMQKAALEAMQANEAEYNQLIDEIQTAIGDIGADPYSREILDYYRAAVAGEHDPFDPRTTANITSQATAPLYAAADAQRQRLNESMAARGLGRSGGLGSLEQQIMQDAVQNAMRTQSDVQSRARLENTAFRDRAAAGQAGYTANLNAQRNQLYGSLFNARMNKTWDPNYFRLQGSMQTQPYLNTAGAGRQLNSWFQPTADPSRRLMNTRAPTYSFQGMGNRLGS